jgi:hypothetical protein
MAYFEKQKTKPFKYQAEFDKNGLQNCPPTTCKAIKMAGHRFVFQDPLHPNNFLPAFLIKPSRVNDSRDLTSKCQGFGLSLFQASAGAKEKFEEMMVKTKGNFAKLVGDHLATVELGLVLCE